MRSCTRIHAMWRGLSAGHGGIRAAIRVVAFLLAGSAFAAVDGTVVNRTTGKPQPGATVTLFKFGSAGPEALASVQSDAGGKFRIQQDLPQGPSLIETAYQGVTYNRMLEPGGAGSNLELEVFETSRRPGSARLAQHMVVLEPQGPYLNVSETFFFSNSGKLTYHDPASGTLRFFLPEALQGQPRVMVTAPKGMPIRRAPGKTSQPNLYKLDFPIKPGETRIDLTYALPAAGTFSGKTLYDDAPTRLVVPAGVTLAGDGLAPLGQDPTMLASVYELKGRSGFTVRIEGTGSLRAATPAEDAGPSIDQILPRIYDNLPWIIAPVLAILALGFVLLYRMSPRPQAAAPKRRG